MNKPYLIQRGRFGDSKRQGLDGIVDLDYMGSAEFEFGKLPKSLKRIRSGDYDYFNVKIDNKEITIFCDKTMINEVLDNVIHLSKDDSRLKEYPYFLEYITDEGRDWMKRDFWWDIENDYMFWKADDIFTIKFITSI